MLLFMDKKRVSAAFHPGWGSSASDPTKTEPSGFSCSCSTLTQGHQSLCWATGSNTFLCMGPSYNTTTTSSRPIRCIKQTFGFFLHLLQSTWCPHTNKFLPGLIRNLSKPLIMTNSQGNPQLQILLIRHFQHILSLLGHWQRRDGAVLISAVDWKAHLPPARPPGPCCGSWVSCPWVRGWVAHHAGQVTLLFWYEETVGRCSPSKFNSTRQKSI